MNSSDLRLACLLPSATDIVVALNLASNIVGVTHECDNKSIFENENKNDGLRQPIQILTSSEIDPHNLTQANIHMKVQGSINDQSISLYNIQEMAFQSVQPNIIVTQALCDVCAVSVTRVEDAVSSLEHLQNPQKQKLQYCPIKPSKIDREKDTGDDDSQNQIKILSLEPEDLQDVTETFVKVANICGVKDRGLALKEKFWSDLHKVEQIVGVNHTSNKTNKAPRILMLEWLQPPFIGGHWVPDMIRYAGCTDASSSSTAVKSQYMPWEDVQAYDPDCILVACCGFDLKRNIMDALQAKPMLQKFRAFHNNRIYGADGNRYFSRPGPTLVGGTAIFARCAYDDINTDITTALDALDFMPKRNVDWAKIDFENNCEVASNENGLNIEH